MTPARTLPPYLAVALTLLSTGACNNSLTTGNAGPGEEVTRDIGVTARDEIEAILSAFTLQSSLDPLGTAQASAPTAFASPPCVTSSSPDDSDGDGIPDDAVYLFTAPPCRFTGWRGGTLDIVGQLRIQDPAPTQAGFGYEATLTGLRTRFTSSDGKSIYDVSRNGTRVLSGSVSELLLSTDLQVLRTFSGQPDAAVDQQWAVTFSPAGPLQINVPLPSGSLDIGGTVNWTRGTEDYTLTVTTPTRLHYNATCTDTVQRIDSGEMRLTGSFGDASGSVRVRWSECGKDPSYAFIGP